MDDSKQAEPRIQSNQNPLAQAIADRASELTRRVVAQIYENPFWDDRFGVRGRRFSEEDGQYHLSYLSQALAAGSAGDVAILTHYAGWLRGVLVSRGMCSRHLAENFDRLAAVLRQEPIDGVERGVAFLQQASQSLRYFEGPAQQLQAHEEAILEHVIAAICNQHPSWVSPVAHKSSLRDFCDDELRTYLSYLADALATARPELFAKYLSWSRDFLTRRSKQAGADAPRIPQASVLIDAIEQAIVNVAPHVNALTAPSFSAARQDS